MSDDTEMCTTTKTGNTITEVAAKDKNVIAFVAFNDASWCWVLKIPEQGFRVIVR
jgi:diadenosine tetraphosphate (Ap4A) HIT family hydrolase